MDWEKVYRDLKRSNWLILLILTLISLFLMSHVFTTGIVLVGLIIIANFHLFQHTIRCAFSPEGIMRATKISIIVKYYFRLLALGIIMYIVIARGWVEPVGLVIGLSTVVISIVSFGIKRALKTHSREATE